MAAQTYPDYTQRVGAYNEATWKPLMNQRLDPGYFGETYTNGMLSHYFDLLELADRTMNITTRDPKVFEKGEWEVGVETGTAIAAGSAGADISFTIAASNQDTVVVGEVILLPGQFQTSGQDRQYVITNITSSVVTAKPRSADGTAITPSQISAEIPAGTVLSIVGFGQIPGGTLPDSKYNYRTVRNYSSVIIDVKKTFEGGTQALKWYEVKSDVDGNSAWFEGQAEMELEFSKYSEGEFWMGELNDNATLTATSAAGGINKQRATKGVYSWAKEVGQGLGYNGSTMDVSYLYDAKDLFLAKMVSCTDVSLLCGSDLRRALEQGGVQFVGTYSGGSDFMSQMYELNVGFNRFHVNGMDFHIKEIKALSNPMRFGNKAYNLSKSGILIPETFDNAEYEGKKMDKSPSLMIGHLNNNGEDRTRIVGVIDGTTGRSVPTNQQDVSYSFVKSEWAAIVLRPEQLIYVEQSA